MNALFKIVLAAASVAIATQAAAQVSFYERPGFEGRSFTTERQIRNFARFGFNDRASSAVVVNDRWEVCEDARFSGRCVVLRPGRYPSLAAMGLNNRVSSVRAVNRNARINDHRYAPAPVATQITFFEHPGFEGWSLITEKPIDNFSRHDFNDRASSVEVIGDRWEVCEHTQFNGRCVVLRPGRYPSLAAMGLNDRVSSVRAIDRNAHIDDRRYGPEPAAVHNGLEAHTAFETRRYAPESAAAQNFHRRPNERLYEANVTSVRAVLTTLEQRCWVEEIAQDRRSVNMPGAIAGTITSGILGHQVGDGRTQDIATPGGSVAGAAVGAHIGRGSNGQSYQTRDVERCETAPNLARPDFWDVSYNFRGQAHRMQMTAPPGHTVTVNERGEPRE
ncbi:MAG: beta/gamma crystallin-related protein [Thiobacillus sp.]